MTLSLGLVSVSSFQRLGLVTMRLVYDPGRGYGYKLSTAILAVQLGRLGWSQSRRPLDFEPVNSRNDCVGMLKNVMATHQEAI